MAAPASSGTNQQLTLDDPSFEKLLAAAWVLQCLHDQLHNPQVFERETIAEPVKAPTRIEPVTSVLPEVIKPVIQAIQTPPSMTEAESKPEPARIRSAD